MPRYYFDLNDRDGLAVDEEGMILRDLDEAQDEAARTLGDMARDASRHTRRVASEQMAIEVRDEIGSVMRVHFSFKIERKN